MDVLISGAGIAGPTLAWWLLRQGHRITLLEKAPRLRSGGYVIDFWGKGYDIAERMGLLPRLEAVGYHIEKVLFVGDRGERRGGFKVSAFDRATHGRFVSLPRSELSRAIVDALGGEIELRFNDEITRLEQDGRGVSVRLASGGERRFDMVVGCEGLHSRTRDLAFGAELLFERFLGYSFAAYTIDGYHPRTPDTYVMHGEPGRQAARVALRDGTTLVLLIWRDPEGRPLPRDPPGETALLRRTYADGQWEVPELLDALENVDDLYVDRVSQIRMDRWHKGRIGLLGDAAFAPSFLAGQGSALAMIGAYVLAGELKRSDGDVAAAFAAYEARLKDFMRGKQDAARKMASSFVPRTRLGLAFRAAVSRLLSIGPIADLFVGRSLQDQIALSDY